MAWIGIDVALAVIGLLVLAGFSVRLWRQVRTLGREVGAASARIATASEQITRNASPSRSEP